MQRQSAIGKQGHFTNMGTRNMDQFLTAVFRGSEKLVNVNITFQLSRHHGDSETYNREVTDFRGERL